MTDESRRIAEEVNRRGTLLARIAEKLNQVLRELASIRTELQDRPTRSETVQRRRGSILLILFIIVSVAWITDVHIENCGPGGRTEPIVERFLEQAHEGSGFDIEELMKTARRPLSDHCDITWPVHTHESDPWPSTGNLIGLASYILIFGALYVWYRWPSRWSAEKQGRNAVTGNQPVPDHLRQIEEGEEGLL